VGITLLAFLACGDAPSGPADAPRHLVLISVDTLGAKHVGAYGHTRDTSPAIDALARRGVLFEHAYTQQVWTLTAHLSLMTSLNPQAHGASERRAAWPAAPTLPAVLSGAGFETAAFTGVGGYMSPRYGLGRGFRRYAIGATHDARDDARRIAWLREQAERAARDPGHRFFLFSHYFDVHSDVGTDVPYAAPEADARRYLDEVLPDGESWGRRGDTDLLIELEKSGAATERDRAVIGALYDAGVRYTDREGVGRLLAAIDALGLAASTLVVLTSDHGEEIFEHGKVSHQQPFDETARIPLVFAGPGVPEGVRRD
jgi:arylsulfatase A-like enzyme